MTFGKKKLTARTFADSWNLSVRLPSWASRQLGWEKGMELAITIEGKTLHLHPSPRACE